MFNRLLPFLQSDSHNWSSSSLIIILGKNKILADLSCCIPCSFRFFGFRNSDFVTDGDRQPCVQPPTWTTRSLYLFPPVRGLPRCIPRHPFRRLLLLERLRWRHSNPTLQGEAFPYIRRKFLIANCVINKKLCFLMFSYMFTALKIFLKEL
jgi:hypothetical protein